MTHLWSNSLTANRLKLDGIKRRVCKKRLSDILVFWTNKIDLLCQYNMSDPQPSTSLVEDIDELWDVEPSDDEPVVVVQAVSASKKPRSRIRCKTTEATKRPHGAAAAAAEALTPQEHIKMRREPVRAPIRKTKNSSRTLSVESSATAESALQPPTSSAIPKHQFVIPQEKKDQIRSSLENILERRRLSERSESAPAVLGPRRIFLPELLETARSCPTDSIDRMLDTVVADHPNVEQNLVRAALAGIVTAQHAIAADLNRILANTPEESPMRRELLMLRDRCEGHPSVYHLP